MDKNELKTLLKENLQIHVTTESDYSDCGYSENTYIEVLFDGELISKTEIEPLSKNY